MMPTRATETPIFTFAIPTKGIKAQAKEIEGQFVVVAGSSARARWEGAAGGYESLYEQLCASGTRSANGRKSWVVEGKALTYGAWQEQQLNDE